MNDLHVIFGAGPAGRATLHALNERGLRVRVITRSSQPMLPEGVELLHGDATDAVFTARACQGACTVYQTLNAPYDQWAERFPPLQRGVLAGARAAGARLVSLENLYAYGPVDGEMTEDLPLAPTTRKGRVRAEMTRELLAARDAGEIEIVIARASDFYGPGVRQSALGERVLGPLASGRAAEVIGDPDKLHSYTCIGDVGEALAILGTRPEAVGKVWHIPSETVSTRAAVDALATAMGTRCRISAAPRPVLWLASWFNPMAGEVLEMTYQFERDFIIDDSAFRTTFGLVPTPLAEAARATASWFTDQAQEVA